MSTFIKTGISNFLLGLLLFVFFFFSGKAFAVTPTFTAADITGDNENGIHAVTGDIDNDGDLDIYVANNNQNKIWINNGNCSFTSSNITGDLGRSTDAFMGDIDSDGDLDIYVVNYNEQNKLWINNGDGTFIGSIIDGDLGYSNSTVMGDVDNDGDLDIYVANYDNEQNKLWINDGLGSGGSSFTATNITDDLGNSNSAVMGDIDNDGDLDIYVANEGQQNKLWLNNGSGGFTSSDIDGDSGPSMGAIMGDVDNDGDLDIYVANYSAQNKLWLNNGSGGFTSSDIDGDSSLSMDSVMGDVDNDGDLDIYVANYSVQNKLWLNNGSGTFTSSDIDGDTGPSKGSVMGDLDGDGYLDIYVVNSYSEAGEPQNKLWINNIPESVATYTASDINTDLGNSRGIATGDIDNDGDIDIYTANWSEQNKLWINDGSGGFTASDITGDLGATYGAVMGDIDNDGDLDIYTPNNEQQNKLWINDGLGNGGTSFTSSDIVGDTGNSYHAVMGDIDNDGDLDIYTVNRLAQSILWINDGQGNGGASFTSSEITGDTGYSQIAIMCDIDNDGDLDIYAVNKSNNQNNLWLNDGLGNGAASFSASIITGDTGNSEDAAIKDIDNDGDLDIYVANYGGQNKLWINDGLGNGGSSFTASDITGDLGYSRGAEISDIDNDGDFDIYVTTLDAQNKLWINDGLGNGGASFTSSDITGDLWESSKCNILDVDNDGDLDIYVANVNQQNKLWINTLKYKPTLTAFSTFVNTVDEDTEVAISFSDLTNEGNESDIDGTVDAFVVKSVTSGTLKIGATSVAATDWASSLNDTIDASNNAFWTPAADANGTLNAFAVVAKDNDDLESADGNVTVQVDVMAVNDAPTFFKVGNAMVTTNWASEFERGEAVVQQSDGKIIVAGKSTEGGLNSLFALFRYNSDGTLDTTFDDDGKVTLPTTSNDKALAVTLQSDGKILVGGYGWSSTMDYRLFRCNSDGSLDTSFGTGGLVVTDFASTNEGIRKILIQSDGNIIAAGFSNQDFAIARYYENGTLDTTFDTDGMATYAVGPGNDVCYSATLQSDGKIILAGYAEGGATTDMAIIRCNTDGSLDTSFNTTGKVLCDLGSYEYGYGVAIQSDDKIVVGGQGYGISKDYAVVRYNTDGTLDTSFNTNGYAITEVSGSIDCAYSIVIQSDGAILLSGVSHNGTNTDFSSVRYKFDGTLDTSFSDDGMVITPIGSNSEECFDVVQQSDGKILCTGYSSNGSNDDIALVRYDLAGNLDKNFNYGTPFATALVYTENDVPLVLDSSLIVRDSELNTANYDGSTLTLLRNGGASNQDTFSNSGNLNVMDQGGALILSATTVGTVTTNSNGTLLLTFNSNATSAIVDEVLQSLTYANSSDNPPANVQINWSLSDENSGAQGSGGVLTDSGNTTINITEVNDAPTLTAFVGPVNTVDEDTELEISFDGLIALGDESDIDGTVDSFVVKSVISGTLRIGTTSVDATAWVASSNDTIDASNNAFWTPDADANGTLNAFAVVAKDNDDLESVGNVTVQVDVTPVNDAPVITNSLDTSKGLKLYQFDGASGDSFGTSVSSAGDVNNDGYDDVIIGADWASDTAGEASVYSGINGERLYKFIGLEEWDFFGFSVSTAGDVNNDGYDDVIIGAEWASPDGESSAGSAYVYSGIDGERLYQFDGVAEEEYFGHSVSNAGDVNKDGYDDVIIGAYRADSSTGSAYVYSGIDGERLYKFDGLAENNYFGTSVSTAGDVNNDGYVDFIIGAYGVAHDEKYSAGSAYVYSGLNGALLYQFKGVAENDYFGYSVSNAGDVNKDGYDDVIIGAKNADPNESSNAGSAYVYSGIDGERLYKFDGLAENNYFGTSVSNAGDVNKDGYVDLIIGAYGANSSAGSAYIYSGSDGTLIHRFDGAAGNNFGKSVSSAGDVNKDGISDVIISAKGANSSAGSAYVYTFDNEQFNLSAIDEDIADETNVGTLVSAILTSNSATLTDAENDTLGIAVTGLTDINGEWQYSIDNGSNWNPISTASPSNGSALLLAETDKIRFVPVLNSNGEDNGWIKFKAWDKTSGVSGDTTADTTTGTAWSLSAETASITVNPINDTPTLTAIPDPVAINEDATEQTVNLSGIGSGVTSGTGIENETLVVTAVSDNTGLIPNPTVTYTSPETTGSLAYRPVSDNHGTATITVTVTDSGRDGIAGNGDDLFVSDTFIIIVNPINDTPSLTAISDPVAINEDATEQIVNLSGIGSGVTSGTGIENETLVVTAVSDNTGLIPNPTVTYTSPEAIGSLAYTPVANAYGTANITVTVTDSGLDGISSNGDDLFVSDTFIIIVNPVNDTPSLTAISDPIAINEDATEQIVNLSGIGSGVTSGPGIENDTLVVTAVSDNTGLIPNPTVTYTSPETTGSLAYTPAANAHGTANITVTVTDSGLDGISGNGDDLFVSHSFMVTVNLVNDAPVLNNLIVNNLYQFNGVAEGDHFGISVSTAGDVNKDGYDDVIIGASGISQNNKLFVGSAYVYSGNGGTLLHQFNGVDENGYFGMSVSTAGDVNKDGYDDVIIGAAGISQNNKLFVGSAYVYSGNGGALLHQFNGVDENGYFGMSVSTAGDVNKDGYDDVIIGAPWVNEKAGSAFVYSGHNGELLYKLDGVAENDNFGISLSNAGDVNKDGYDDVIIGAYEFDSDDDSRVGYASVYSGYNGEHLYHFEGVAEFDGFGYSVSTAGDVNKDGYDDVIIGAYGTNSYAGSAYVYSSYNGELLHQFEGLAANNGFGYSVSNAGDVNNDGYDDVIIGAFGANSYAGSAYVYSGSNGKCLYKMDGAAENDYFGYSVSNAGDLNNDGIDDLVIGAYNMENKSSIGSAYIYTFNSVQFTLTPIGEDIADESNEGMFISTILTSNTAALTDVENDTLGIAVTDLTDINGEWQYSIDNGSNWSAISSASIADDSALLLAETDKIRFVPVLNSNGKDNGWIKFKAWDKTSGASGDTTADTTIGTAWSLNVETASITVNPVNDTPTLAAIPDPVAINEDATEQIVNLSGIGSGVTSGTGIEIDTLVITAVSDNTGLIPNPTVTYTSPATTGSLAYTPVANAYGTANITVTVTDSGLDGISGNGDDLSVSHSFMVTVNPINDTPTLVSISDPAAIDEDATEQIVNLSGVGSGVTSGPGIENDTLAVTAVSDNTGLIPNPTVTYTSPEATGSIAYTPVANAYGTANITVTVTDSGLDGISGNADDLFVNDTFTVTVNAVNDAPVLVAETTLNFDSIYENLDIQGNTSDNPTGLTVQNILNNSVTDIEQASFGIAVIGVTGISIETGKWQYSELSDSENIEWIDFSSDISMNNALLLNPESLIRYLPVQGYYGEPSFTYNAWDKSSDLVAFTYTNASDAGMTGSVFSQGSSSSAVKIYDYKVKLRILNETVSETQGVIQGCTLEIPLPLDYDAEFLLTATGTGNYEQRLTLPMFVTVAAGTTSENFDIAINDNANIDGECSFVITPVLEKWKAVSYSLTIIDDEVKTMSLVMPAEVNEGSTLNSAKLILSGKVLEPLTINLASTIDSIVLPETVIVSAESDSIQFTFDVTDDTRLTGPRTSIVSAEVTLSGITPEWTGATGNLVIVDNEEKKMDLFAVSSASEKAGLLEEAGKIVLRGSVDEDTIVYLSSSDVTRLTVPEQVIIPANTLEQVFSITIIDDQIQNLTDGVIITALESQAGYESTLAELFIQDDDYDRSLGLTVNHDTNTIQENSGINSGFLTLSVSPVQSEGVVVDLDLSHEGIILLTEQVIVPANFASVKIDITAIDNDYFNKINKLLITATAHGYSKSSLLLNVDDDEQKNIVLNLPSSVLKTDGLLTNAGSVTIPKGLTQDLVITLASLDTSLVTLPSSVTVTAGQTTEYFDITIVDNKDYLNIKSVEVQAYSTGWSNGMGRINVFNPPKAEIAPTVIKAGLSDQEMIVYINPDCMGITSANSAEEISSNLEYKSLKISFVKEYFVLNNESGTGAGKLNLLITDLYDKAIITNGSEIINTIENSVTVNFTKPLGYATSALLRPLKVVLSGSVATNPPTDISGNSITAPRITLTDTSKGTALVREVTVLSGDGDMNGSATGNSLNFSVKAEILPSLTTIISEVQSNSFNINSGSDMSERTKQIELFINIPNIPDNKNSDKVDGRGVNQLSLNFPGVSGTVDSIVYYTGSPFNTVGVTMEPNIDYIKNVDPINSANKIIGFTKSLATSTVQTSEYLKVKCTLVLNGFEELIEVSGTMSYSDPQASSDTPVIKALITPGSADGILANGDTMMIKVNVVTQSPELSNLSIFDHYDLASQNSAVKRKARIKWEARDKDSSFVTDLYWSVQDYTQAQVLEELKKSEPAIYLVNDKEIFNAGMQIDMVNLKYFWDVSLLHDMETLFEGTASESKPLYLYAVSTDDNPITENQILKSGSSFTVTKPEAENLKPELVFSISESDGLYCDTEFEIKFVLKDDTADNLKVTLFYSSDYDSLRSMGCVDNNSAYIIETITPDLNSADKFTEKSLIWNTTQVMGGSYFIMAKIEDGVHQDMEVWSDYRINVKHAATDNIAPAIKWTSPDLNSDSVETSENIVLNYEFSDENGDILSVQFGYATGNVVSEVRELKTISDIDTSNGAVSGSITFSIKDISAGAYYIYTQIKETGKTEPPVVSWSRYPIEVNKGKNIYDLAIGSPEADPDNAGKCKCTVAFKTDCAALGSIEYGFSDISFTEITELKKGVNHNLVLTNLEPGKTYLFRALASISTTAGLKKEYLDNQGLYYEIPVPENILASTQACYVKGKINTQSAGIVKIYVVKPVATTEENESVSSPFIVTLDTFGQFTADIGDCVFDTTLVEVPQSSWLARVEVILDNGRYLYIEDIPLTGIENAVDIDSALVLDRLWNDGIGAEAPDTGLEKSKIALKKGFNMISLVLEPDEVLMASDILKIAGENAIMIAMYDAVTAGYKSYLRVDGDVFLGDDFRIKSEISFFIKVLEAAEYTFTGQKFKKSRMINLVKGFNLVSIPFSRKFPASHKTGMTAKSILKRIGKDGLAVYKYLNGAYVSYLRVGTNDKGEAIFLGANFDIELGEGIFIYAKADTSFWAE